MLNALLKTFHPARARLLKFLIGANLAGSGACEKSAVFWQMTPLSFALFLGARSNQKALTRFEEPILSFKQEPDSASYEIVNLTPVGGTWLNLAGCGLALVPVFRFHPAQ